MVSERLRSSLFSKQSLFSLLLVAAAFLALYLLFDISAAIAMISETDLLLYSVALLLFYIPFLFRGERWRLLLQEAGIETSLRSSTEVTFMSFFMNAIIPAQLGDLYRGHLLGIRDGLDRSKITGTVFVTRFTDFSFLVASTSLLTYFVAASRFGSAFQYLKIGYIALALIMLGFLAVLYFEGLGFLPAKAEKMLEKFKEGATRCVSRSNIGWIVLYTCLIWFFVVMRLYTVSTALGLELSITVAGFVGLFMIMLTILPLTPGGLGVVEVISTGFMAFLGFSQTEILSLVLLDRTISMFSLILFGGLFYLYTDKKVI